MAVYYFAYGSNLAPNVMARLCPEHRFLGVARLNGYRIAFTRRSVRTGTGVADIVAEPGSTVWGVLYEISDEDVAILTAKRDMAGPIRGSCSLSASSQAPNNKRLLTRSATRSRAQCAPPGHISAAWSTLRTSGHCLPATSGTWRPWQLLPGRNHTAEKTSKAKSFLILDAGSRYESVCRLASYI